MRFISLSPTPPFSLSSVTADRNGVAGGTGRKTLDARDRQGFEVEKGVREALETAVSGIGHHPEQSRCRVDVRYLDELTGFGARPPEAGKQRAVAIQLQHSILPGIDDVQLAGRIDRQRPRLAKQSHHLGLRDNRIGRLRYGEMGDPEQEDQESNHMSSVSHGKGKGQEGDREKGGKQMRFISLSPTPPFSLSYRQITSILHLRRIE